MRARVDDFAIAAARFPTERGVFLQDQDIAMLFGETLGNGQANNPRADNRDVEELHQKCVSGGLPMG